MRVAVAEIFKTLAAQQEPAAQAAEEPAQMPEVWDKTELLVQVEAVEAGNIMVVAALPGIKGTVDLVQ
jgi:hypothetical protein